MKKLDIMTPSHPKWRAFCDRLGGPEGCDFKEGPKGPTFKCSNMLVKARQFLEEMDGIDVPNSLAYFESCGGYCDCEVLFNVDGR